MRVTGQWAENGAVSRGYRVSANKTAIAGEQAPRSDLTSSSQMAIANDCGDKRTRRGWVLRDMQCRVNEPREKRTLADLARAFRSLSHLRERNERSRAFTGTGRRNEPAATKPLRDKYDSFGWPIGCLRRFELYFNISFFFYNFSK